MKINKNHGSDNMSKILTALRFPEFGEEWKIEPLDKIYSFKITNSLSRDKLNYEGGEVKNIHYGDIHTKFSTLFDITKEKVPFINQDVSIERIDEENYCKEGDIVIADASEDLDDIGKSIEIINLNNEKLLAGLHTFLARRRDKKIVLGFGGYLFKSDDVRKQIKKEAQGAKVLGISKSRISSINIYYPNNPAEQQKIAACLSSLDEVITAETEKLDLLQDHKKGLLQQLFPAEGETQPKFRFPEFKKDGDWEEHNLGKICKYFNGGSHEKNVTDNGDYYLISLNSIDIEGNLKEEMKRVSHSDNSLVKNDLVMVLSDVAHGNFLGLCAIIPNEKYVLNQRMAGLRLRNMNVNVQFLRFFINNNQKYFKRTGQGSSQQNLAKSSVENFPVLLPKKHKEQQKIADCLSAADALIEAQTQKIKSLQEHKKGLLQQLFPNVNELAV